MRVTIIHESRSWIRHPSVAMERAALLLCDMQSLNLRDDIIQVAKMMVKSAKTLGLPVCVGEDTSKPRTGLSL